MLLQSALRAPPPAGSPAGWPGRRTLRRAPPDGNETDEANQWRVERPARQPRQPRVGARLGRAFGPFPASVRARCGPNAPARLESRRFHRFRRLARWIAGLANIQVEQPAPLVPSWVDGRLRLLIRQPANQAFQLEVLDDLSASDWQRLDLPDTEPTFPTAPRDVIVELESDADWKFCRTHSRTP
jgi:hypothetical protein